MSVEARRMKNLPVSISATRPRNRAAVSILAIDWVLKVQTSLDKRSMRFSSEVIYIKIL